MTAIKAPQRPVASSETKLRSDLTKPCPNCLKLVFTEIRGLYKPGHNPPKPKWMRHSGYKLGYTSEEDNNGRIFINHIFIVKNHHITERWANGQQFIELTVKLNPADEHVDAQTIVPPPESKVDWYFEYTENKEVREYRKASLASETFPHFEEITGYKLIATKIVDKKIVQCRTEILDGVSKVRLHLSNTAGDYYRVFATMELFGEFTKITKASTGKMTMWNRLSVECAKMPGTSSVPIEGLARCYEDSHLQIDTRIYRTLSSRHNFDNISFATLPRGRNECARMTLENPEENPGALSDNVEVRYCCLVLDQVNRERMMAVLNKAVKPYSDNTISGFSLNRGWFAVIAAHKETKYSSSKRIHKGEGKILCATAPNNDKIYQSKESSIQTFIELSVDYEEFEKTTKKTDPPGIIRIIKPGTTGSSRNTFVRFEIAPRNSADVAKKDKVKFLLKANGYLPPNDFNGDTVESITALDLREYGFKTTISYDIEVWTSGHMDATWGYAPCAHFEHNEYPIKPDESPRCHGASGLVFMFMEPIFSSADRLFTLSHEFGHALGAAHACGNPMEGGHYTCVMNDWYIFRRGKDGKPIPWTQNNRTNRLCRAHRIFYQSLHLHAIKTLAWEAPVDDSSKPQKQKPKKPGYYARSQKNRRRRR